MQFPPVYTRSSTSGRTVHYFHTDPLCDNFPDTGRPVTMDHVYHRNLVLCAICAGDDNRGQTPANDPTKFHDLIEQAQRNDPDLPNPQT